MKKLIVFFLLLQTVSCFGQNPNPSVPLDEYIMDEMQAEHFPGVASVIVKNGEIVWLQCYGFADIENGITVTDSTQFLLASMSKLFTGTATMQLKEDGMLQLNNDINEYLPWPLNHPVQSTTPMTIHQLMTHTSSIKDNWSAMSNYYGYPDPTISLEACMQDYFTVTGQNYNANQNFLSAPPGTVFNYSNMATALNGYITEIVSSMPFDNYCEEHIFEPLCMEKTAWHMADLDSNEVARPYSYSNGNFIANPHYGFADYPDGQLRSSITDLANYMIAFLNGGSLGSNAILSPSSVSEMWTQQIPSIESKQGLNWYKELLYHSGGETLLWGHNGGELGVSTDMYVDPESNIGLCVLSNGGGTNLYICDELYDYALSLNPISSIVPQCGFTNIPELYSQDKELIKIIDILGRETIVKPNTPLIYIYSDGSCERVFKIE
ncbi:beta-lactamase family protein [Crocinitomicaceae bacterium]|nr:beta-lactamase family protein [Crocinitomicaceae bacterium]